MGKRKIVITPKAEEDLHEIFDYLSQYSHVAAHAQIERIFDKLELLKIFPRIGQVIIDFENDQLRELIIGNYKIAYYLVSEKQIDILTVHHGSKSR